MKKKFLIPAVLILSMFVFSSMALAASSASISGIETALGGGWWQYDYTVANLSTAGESFYEMYLDFGVSRSEEGILLPYSTDIPPGWADTVWMGANTTSYLDTYSTGPSYDLAAGSSLSDFKFKVNYPVGSIPYTATFAGSGGPFTTTGMTTIVPEPISSILFLVGGATLIGRHYRKRKQLKSI